MFSTTYTKVIFSPDRSLKFLTFSEPHHTIEGKKERRFISPILLVGRRIRSSAFLSWRLFEYFLPIASYAPN